MNENDAIYRSPAVVKQFQEMNRAGLTAPEKDCLDLVPLSRRHSVLDIGVGGGRTTGPLSKIFEKYVGIDYSDNMVAATRSLFPTVELCTMDARNLVFSEQFDCVMFSFNGIDYVSYDDRQLILQQVASVLKPGGVFIYSTHNLHCVRAAAFFNKIIVKELFVAWPRVRSTARLFRNRLSKFWQQTADQSRTYAYINDPGSWFSLLTTYVDIAGEVKVLEQHGFSILAMIGDAKQAAGYDANDNWVYIVASRP
jgi:SAM-dependent methyltransferase